jgi:hypothetical protein
MEGQSFTIDATFVLALMQFIIILLGALGFLINRFVLKKNGKSSNGKYSNDGKSSNTPSLAVLENQLVSVMDNCKNRQPQCAKEISDLWNRFNGQVSGCTERFMELENFKGAINTNLTNIDRTLRDINNQLQNSNKGGKK